MKRRLPATVDNAQSVSFLFALHQVSIRYCVVALLGVALVSVPSG
jgi:hypothetical protein